MKYLNQLIGNVFRSHAEKKFLVECKKRIDLNDADYVAMFYGELSPVKSRVVVVARRVVDKQLGFPKVWPEDDLSEVFPDAYYGEVAKDIGEELGYTLDNNELLKLDGTFGSIVTYLFQCCESDKSKDTIH